MNRRDFLKSLALAGVAGPVLWSQTGCAPALIRADATTGLSLGYVSGDVTANSALIWLRAEPGSQVSLQYAKAVSYTHLTLPTIYSV